MKSTKLYIGVFITMIIGFLWGKDDIRLKFPEKNIKLETSIISDKKQKKNTQKKISTPVFLKQEKIEKPIILLKKISGDQIFLDITGDVKILWDGGNHIETYNNSKTVQIPEKIPEKKSSYTINLGQIPDQSELNFRSFKYVGNAKTHKFYPSTTYWARGTAIKYRRFFQTKLAARNAGFKPSKSVK